MIRLKMNPLTESATLLRRAGVVLGSVGLTALFSLLVLLRALFGRLNRPIVDQYCREWSASLLRLVRASLTVRGQVPDFGDGRRYIIMCTHASHYDIPVTFVSLPGSIRMLAKKELFSIPLLGQAMRAAEFPSVDRSNRQRAVRDLEKARGLCLWPCVAFIGCCRPGPGKSTLANRWTSGWVSLWRRPARPRPTWMR